MPAQNVVASSNSGQSLSNPPTGEVVRVGRLRLFRPPHSLSGLWVGTEQGASHYVTGVSRQQGREIYHASYVRALNGQVTRAQNAATTLTLPSRAELLRDLVPLLRLQSNSTENGSEARYSRPGYPGSYSLEQHFLIYLLDLQPSSTAGSFTRPGFHSNPRFAGHTAEYSLDTRNGRPIVRFSGGRTQDGHQLPPQEFSFCHWSIETREQRPTSSQNNIAGIQLPRSPTNQSRDQQGGARPQVPQNPVITTTQVQPQVNQVRAERPSERPQTRPAQSTVEQLLLNAQRLQNSGSPQALYVTSAETQIVSRRREPVTRPTNELAPNIFARAAADFTAVPQDNTVPRAANSETTTYQVQRIPPSRTGFEYLAFYRPEDPENSGHSAIVYLSSDDSRLPEGLRFMLRQQYRNPYDTFRSLPRQHVASLGITTPPNLRYPPQYRFAVASTGDVYVREYRADQNGRYAEPTAVYGCSIPRLFQFLRGERFQGPLFEPVVNRFPYAIPFPTPL